MKGKKKQIYVYSTLLLLVFLCTSCGLGAKETKGTGKKIDFIICKKENIPKELKAIIKEKKKKPFQLSYRTKEYTFLVVGYGEQSTKGYSIQVMELYELQKIAVLKTRLIRSTLEERKQGISYPYFVIKIQNVDKPISFR